MKVKSIRIRGFRTLKDELELPLDDTLTLVGPNNAGKTNSLRAIVNFFTGYENRFGYDYEQDVCKGPGTSKTNIQLDLVEITAESDPEIHEAVLQVRQQLGIETGSNNEITLYLTFSQSSNPAYRVFPNTKRPKGPAAANYSRAEKKLFSTLFDTISIHYIPSEKSVAQLYEELVRPFLLEEVYGVIEPHLASVKNSLKEVSDDINQSLDSVGLGDFSISFELPSSPYKFLNSIEFHLSDENKTSAFAKGMGIQSVALLSCFCWIAKKEKASGKLVMWLLEEPESYLHPQLAGQSENLIKQLSKDSQVVYTTHSLAFVPQNPEKVVGLESEDGWTKSSKFKTYHEATAAIRKSLGVKFSDFYNFSEFNILTEGQTDRKYFENLLGILRQSPDLSAKFPNLVKSEVSIHDYGGVKGLEGFLRATLEFIQPERKCVVVLDGDEAGDRTRRALVGFFGNKPVSFEANKDFVIVRDRFPVEGLLPDTWLREIHQEHPSWFEDFSEDAAGTILPFKVRDNLKNSFMNWFFGRATSHNYNEWSERWQPIFEAIDSSFKKTN